MPASTLLKRTCLFGSSERCSVAGVLRSCVYICCSCGSVSVVMPMLSEIASGGRGSFDVRGVRFGVHTYEYRDRAGINKQGNTFVVTFVGTDPECYIQGQIQSNPHEAHTKFAAQQTWTLSTIAFARKDKKWVGAPVKSIINLMGTTKKEIAKDSPEEKALALTTLPPATLAEISALKEIRFCDFIGIIRNVSDTRPGGGKGVRDVVLLDGSRKEGSDLLASPSLTVWGQDLCEKLEGDMVGRVLAVYNAKAFVAGDELKLNTTDQTQFEFPEDIPEFRPPRLQTMINNAQSILAEADGSGVETLTTTFVPSGFVPIDTEGLADHTVCAWAAKGLEDPSNSGLLQVCCAIADLPNDKPVTKDGTRLFFPTMVRDHTGSVQMAITEAAALAMAPECANKEEFIAAWENKSLQFVPSNVRFCRRTRTVGNSMPETDGGPRVYTELIAAAATPTDLTVAPTLAAKDVLGFLRSTGRTAGPVVPAFLENVHNCTMNGLAIKNGNDEIFPVNKVLVLVKGQKGKKSTVAPTEGDGRRMLTKDVISPFWDEEKIAEQKKLRTFDVISYCLEDNTVLYKIDSQHALISVVQVTKKVGAAEDGTDEIALIADAVYPVNKADVASQMSAWGTYVVQAVPPGEEPEEGTPRKCRKLEHHPSDSLFPHTPTGGA